jgi:REP element-mobilizing transposase RayT
LVEAGRYHVWTRSAGKIPIYRDDHDRTDFCNRIGRVVKKFDWRCEGFCLMTTHYHLLLDVHENALQPGMKWLNGTYAAQFNRRHGRWGHLCGCRYSMKPILTRRQLLRSFKYVMRNPVEAEMCEHPADWPWSSYRGTAGYDKPFGFVDDREILAYYGVQLEGARERLREYVEAAREP